MVIKQKSTNSDGDQAGNDSQPPDSVMPLPDYLPQRHASYRREYGNAVEFGRCAGYRCQAGSKPRIPGSATPRKVKDASRRERSEKHQRRVIVDPRRQFDTGRGKSKQARCQERKKTVLRLPKPGT